MGACTPWLEGSDLQAASHARVENATTSPGLGLQVCKVDETAVLASHRAVLVQLAVPPAASSGTPGEIRTASVLQRLGFCVHQLSRKRCVTCNRPRSTAFMYTALVPRSVLLQKCAAYIKGLNAFGFQITFGPCSLKSKVSSRTKLPLGVKHVCFVLFNFCLRFCLAFVVHLAPARSDCLYLCSMAKETGLVGQGHTCANKDIALPECFRASNWNKGWVGEIFSDIVKETAVNVVALTAANFSASSAHVSTDDFSRCIWEVKEGKVDVCVGEIWETESRRRFTSFSSALDVDVFKIVTKTSTRPFRAVQLLNFSKPFEWQLWLVTCTMVVFGGIRRRLAFSLQS